MDELLRRFPNFALQWHKCQLQISKDGVLSSAASVGNDARTKLASATQRLATSQTLLRVLEQHVEDTYAHKIPGDPSAAAAATDLHGGVSSLSIEAVLKAIQALRASQRLRLPPALQRQAGKPPTQDADAALGLTGSIEHLLGVRPEDLLACELPDRTGIQAVVRALLPQVEACLMHNARKVQSALRDLLPPAGASGGDLATALAQKAASTKAERGAVALAFLDYLDAATEQLQHLQAHAQALLTLLGSCKAIRQAHVDQVHAEYKLEHGRALSGKVKQMEAALLLQTYTPKNMMPALRALSSILTEAHEAASASFNQVQQQLAAYQELGHEFEAVVRETRGVQEEVQRVEGHLQSLLAIQRELEAETDGAL